MRTVDGTAATAVASRSTGPADSNSSRSARLWAITQCMGGHENGSGARQPKAASLPSTLTRTIPESRVVGPEGVLGQHLHAIRLIRPLLQSTACVGIIYLRFLHLDQNMFQRPGTHVAASAQRGMDAVEMQQVNVPRGQSQRKCRTEVSSETTSTAARHSAYRHKRQRGIGTKTPARIDKEAQH